MDPGAPSRAGLWPGHDDGRQHRTAGPAIARFFAVFFGTFCPAARASDSPIAIACLRLLTVLPDRPLFKVPALRFFIARPTLAAAFFEYFRAMTILPIPEIIFMTDDGSRYAPL
jgi:hypothetical protein